MTSIDDFTHDLKNVSDTVLGDLDTEERIRIFTKAAADGEDARIQQLVDTAPRREYTATDLEYLNGIKKVGAVSLQARHELQKLYQVITEHETTRDKYMALMLLNESLSRLSRGTVEIDEFGNTDARSHDDADYAYGKKSAGHGASRDKVPRVVGGHSGRAPPRRGRPFRPRTALPGPRGRRVARVSVGPLE